MRFKAMLSGLWAPYCLAWDPMSQSDVERSDVQKPIYPDFEISWNVDKIVGHKQLLVPLRNYLPPGIGVGYLRSSYCVKLKGW